MPEQTKDETAVAGTDVARTPPLPQPVQPSAAPVQNLAALYETGDTGLSDADTVPVQAAQPPAIPAPPAAAAPEPPKPEPKHSKRLLRMATDLGMAAEEIASLSPDELDDEVYHRTREAAILARENRRADTIEARGAPAPAASPPPASPAAPENIDLGLDESQYDPGLLKIMKDQAKELKRLQGELQHVRQREVACEQESTEEAIDRVFGELGASYEPVIGKGRGQELRADGAEFGRRIAIINEASRLAGPKATRNQVIAKIGAAAKSLFAGLATAPSPPTTPPVTPATEATPAAILEQRRQDWNGAGLAKPTNREPQEPKGEAKALQDRRQGHARPGPGRRGRDGSGRFLELDREQVASKSFPQKQAVRAGHKGPAKCLRSMPKASVTL